MAIAWMHRFLKYTNISELTCNGVLDSQAGHSQQTASRIYGRSNFDHPSIGRDEFQLYQLVSIKWHRLLHLASDTLPPYQALANQNYPNAVPASAMGNVYHHHHHQIKVVRFVGNIGINFPSLACLAAVLSSLFALGYDKLRSPY
jgi:superfamily II DNA helicase RecQ